MNKFRVGDIVRCITNECCGITKGKTYEVLDFIPTNKDAVQIIDDKEYAVVYQESEFELVITPEDLANGKYDHVMCRNENIYDYKTSPYTFKELTEDFKPVEACVGSEVYDIMAIYRKEGYELIKVWERKPEIESKEKKIIKLIESAANNISKEFNITYNALTEAVNILKEQGE